MVPKFHALLTPVAARFSLSWAEAPGEKSRRSEWRPPLAYTVQLYDSLAARLSAEKEVTHKKEGIGWLSSLVGLKVFVSVVCTNMLHKHAIEGRNSASRRRGAQGFVVHMIHACLRVLLL